jgi:hypothetical protein
MLPVDWYMAGILLLFVEINGNMIGSFILKFDNNINRLQNNQRFFTLKYCISYMEREKGLGCCQKGAISDTSM